MNIFFVSEDPIEAAQSLVDKHVVKMILESAQLLSTAHRVLDGSEGFYVNDKGKNKKFLYLNDSREKVLYKETHINHPSAVWCRQSVENYLWLVEHFFALMNEYMHRYKKIHKCNGEISYMLQSPPKNLENYDWTQMPSCMPDEYKISHDPIVNYRNYYKIGKKHLHRYTNRNPPDWIV